VSGNGTPRSGTSAIAEMVFDFGNKNPTNVSQLASLEIGASI